MQIHNTVHATLCPMLDLINKNQCTHLSSTPMLPRSVLVQRSLTLRPASRSQYNRNTSEIDGLDPVKGNRVICQHPNNKSSTDEQTLCCNILQTFLLQLRIRKQVLQFWKGHIHVRVLNRHRTIISIGTSCLPSTWKMLMSFKKPYILKESAVMKSSVYTINLTYTKCWMQILTTLMSTSDSKAIFLT